MVIILIRIWGYNDNKNSVNVCQTHENKNYYIFEGRVKETIKINILDYIFSNI